MPTRSAAKKKSRPWTDRAFVHQMAMVKSALEKAPVDFKALSNQCLLLSKVLDSLVANNVKPNQRHDLLPLVQQVCRHKEKPEARPALMILLLSIKSAFRTDWLSTLEVTGNDEIFTTLNLLFDSFTSSQENSAEAPLQALQCGGSAVKEPVDSMNYLISISERFYPRLQLNAVFVAVQAKVGYEVLMCDFHVPHMHIQDRVRLYVIKTDSLETATCLITPPQVNILVNGRQVERRVTMGYLDVGPQMPSDVTGLVKVGASVLQVIGEFSESYVIAVASSRTIEWSAKNTQLKDYVAPTKAASSEVDPTVVDDEVVEGASRLSLRCPISHQRMVTPVKATTCRHLQCFDYDSFLEINENRPAWRCPCCNRFTSCSDLRIVRQMEKVLKETDENILEVIVCQDGSWVPVSTGENQSNAGPDVIPIEGCELGIEVIDLSATFDEELNVTSQYSNEIQLPDRKPEKQTLQAINENKGNPSQGTNPVVQQGSVEQPRGVYVPGITATAPQSSQNFAGPSWALNINGGVVHLPIPESAEMPVQSQPAPSTQAPPAASHSSQGNISQSRTDPISSSPAGPVNGHRTSPQLQQLQIGVPSNTGFVTRSETEWVWQRQSGQQSPRPPQNNHHTDRTRQQWRGPEVPPHQLIPNQAQTRTLQPPQQPFLDPTRAWGNSPPGAGVPPHHFVLNAAQTHNLQPSQQFIIVDPTGTCGGPSPGQWPPSGGNAMQVPSAASALEQNWRPGTIRMRGGVANPPMGNGVLGPSPLALQQRCLFNTVPQYNDFIPHGINEAPVVAGPFQMSMPAPGHLQAMPPWPRGPRG